MKPFFQTLLFAILAAAIVAALVVTARSAAQLTEHLQRTARATPQPIVKSPTPVRIVL